MSDVEIPYRVGQAFDVHARSDDPGSCAGARWFSVPW